MTVPWYEWGNVRDRLVRFGRALQGASPFLVHIEPDPSKCPSGYCDYRRREIAVNPELFAVPPEKQYALTKALLVHEAGHRRFTTPTRLTPLAHLVANVLEDERVERRMGDRFAGVRWLLRHLAEAMYGECVPADPESDSPGQVLGYMFQLRWAERIGLAAKGALSDRNASLWDQTEPLAREAWEAESSETTDRNAQAIVDILGLREADVPVWVWEVTDRLGSQVGDRVEGDVAERWRGTANTDGGAGEDREPEPFDGEVLPNDAEVGTGNQAIMPKPYGNLEERVRPLVAELVDALSWERVAAGPEPAERGGRFSMRRYLRDRQRPFLVEEGERRTPPSLALKVLVDHSTSMNNRSGGGTRMASVAAATMALHLVSLELGISHQIRAVPQDALIAENALGERGKALIAGLVPALCDYEDMGRALQTHATPMASGVEDVKLVLCLTDGACNDAELGKEMCLALRGKVEIIGLLLDPDDETRPYVADMFGADRVIASRSTDLPRKLGDVLRAIRRV